MTRLDDLHHVTFLTADGIDRSASTSEEDPLCASCCGDTEQAGIPGASRRPNSADQALRFT